MSSTTKPSAYCVEYFYAKPEHKPALIAALQKIARLTREEPGCLQYDLLQDKENPNLLVILVKFSNQETMLKHEQQSYVVDFAENEMNRYCDKVCWNDLYLA